MNKNKADDKILKDLVEKLKKEEPFWKELEKDLKYLEKTTKKSREYHLKEALIRYIEDMEDIRDVEKHIKNKDESEYYTPKVLKKRLNLK